MAPVGMDSCGGDDVTSWRRLERGWARVWVRGGMVLARAVLVAVMSVLRVSMLVRVRRRCVSMAEWEDWTEVERLWREARWVL